MIEVTVDKAKLAELERTLKAVPNGLPKVLSRAINKIAVSARAQVVRRVAEEIVIKQADLRDRNITIRRASYDKLWALIRISGKRIPLKYFGARLARQGVSYRISRKGGRTYLYHGFQMKSMAPGHWFQRTGMGGGGKYRIGRISTRLRTGKGQGRGMAYLSKPRLPIAELKGPAIPTVVAGIREFAAGVFDQALALKLEKEIDMQVQVLLQQHEAAKDVAPF